MSGSRERDSDEAKKTAGSDKDIKVNKYTDSEGQPIRHEGPLSEGEDRDDYTNNEKFVDREAFDGKWAEKGGNDAGGGGDASSKMDSMPSESNIEEMDKFLTKVKKDKKEEMLERNKDLLKNKP